MNQPAATAAATSSDPEAVAIVSVPFDHRAAQLLVHSLYAEQLARYGHADPPNDTPAAYRPPDGLFLVAYVDGELAGCGGYRSHAPHTAELRRLYVRPPVRRTSLGKHLLVRLEEEAKASGARRLIFETGNRSSEILSLASQLGYRQILPYRPERDPAVNRAFEKYAG